ncbi:MAG: ATP-binding cassette domain-containing protein, partial [Aquincola sp.]|nr:ATP-binding cassette domain-containing protein [Aquincola sp.]
FLGRNGYVKRGSIQFMGQELVGKAGEELRQLRGDQIAMVYQDPMQALNPSMRLGDQMKEVLTVHRGIAEREAEKLCIEMLDRVYMPDPVSVMGRYPHQISGGQQQRVVIAMALLIALFFPGTDRAITIVLGVIASYALTVLAVSALGLVLSRRNANGPPPSWAPKIGLNSGRWRGIQKALRQLRGSVAAIRHAKPVPMALSFVASALHVIARLCILPGLVLFVAPKTAVAPLIAWPLAMQYGAAVVPAPGGGGAVELVFKQTLGNVIPAEIFGASLVWWRFYTIYLYILVGALVAGSTVMRALKPKALAAARADPDAPSPPPISIAD